MSLDRKSAEIRAFFAIELDDPARRAAAELSDWLAHQPGGDGVRWVRTESLHVTLRFLGDIAAKQVEEFSRCVAREVRRTAPFEIALGSLRGFPTRRHPRVVVLDLTPGRAIQDLASAVERGVVSAGWTPEPRSFRPHLTLGRVRGEMPDLSVAPTRAARPFGVREVVLFRSELASDGARYRALERISLGVSDHPSNQSLEDGFHG